MENKNITYNISIKQANQSNALAYNKKYVATNIDNDFSMLDKAYAETGKVYAKLKMAIESGKCSSDNCDYEYKQLKILEAAPQKSLQFIQQVVDQLNVTEDQYYDVNNDYSFLVANYIMKQYPGFSKTEGYDIVLNLLEDGSQEITFTGPILDRPLVINSNTLDTLINAGSDLVASTPDVNKEMLRLLTEVNVLTPDSIGQDNELTPQAAIADDFVLKNSDGSYDYQIIDIGGGKGRNILKFDLDKIQRTIQPFVNAEVAGMMQQEQEVIAAWNMFIARGSSEEEDDQMMQNANAGSLAWSYKKDLPLSQENKILFESNYMNYFMKNYLKQFITNKLPSVQEDAAVFDLQEAKNAKAEKFMADEKLA